MADQSLARNASTSPSITAHRRETWSFESDSTPNLAATLSTLRVEVPVTYISATAAARARSVRERRSSRPVGKYDPLPGFGILRSSVPTVVSSLRLR